jgi:hypothetical protein
MAVHGFQSILFFATVIAGLSAVREIAQSLSTMGIMERELVDPLMILAACLATLAGLGFWILGRRS